MYMNLPMNNLQDRSLYLNLKEYVPEPTWEIALDLSLFLNLHENNLQYQSLFLNLHENNLQYRSMYLSLPENYLQDQSMYLNLPENSL